MVSPLSKGLALPRLIVYRRYTMNNGNDFLALLCKALGHPARIQIIKHLKEMDRCICGGIVDILPLAQSTVSQHLKCLKEAGLIKGEVEGSRTCYCLDRERFEELKTMIKEL